ncbi:MAG: hypothetical protein ACJAWV_003282 [Flammeovirgaceae bacterium]|jgi:hypothetical protein
MFCHFRIAKKNRKIKEFGGITANTQLYRKLPPEILKLEKLRILDLSENPSFSDIGTVIKMAQLEEFYCFGCHLSKSEVSTLKSRLPNCKIGTE